MSVSSMDEALPRRKQVSFGHEEFVELDSRSGKSIDPVLARRPNGTYTDSIPIIQTNKGTWFSNNTNVIVFDDAGDKGSDARGYGLSIKGKSMKVSLKSSGRGPDEATIELHMIFTKQK